MIRPALLHDLTRGGSKVSKVRGKRVRSTKTETLKSSTVASQGRDERHCLVATACPGLSAPGAAALSIFEPITSARINRSSGPSQVRHITLGAGLSTSLTLAIPHQRSPGQPVSPVQFLFTKLVGTRLLIPGEAKVGDIKRKQKENTTSS